MDFVMHRGRRGLGYLSIYKRLVLVGKVSADPELVKKLPPQGE